MSEDTSKKIEADFYECDKCRKLFVADSWEDARVIVTSSGEESSSMGDKFHEFWQKWEKRLICYKCRNVV